MKYTINNWHAVLLVCVIGIVLNRLGGGVPPSSQSGDAATGELHFVTTPRPGDNTTIVANGWHQELVVAFWVCLDGIDCMPADPEKTALEYSCVVLQSGETANFTLMDGTVYKKNTVVVIWGFDMPFGNRSCRCGNHLPVIPPPPLTVRSV